MSNFLLLLGSQGIDELLRKDGPLLKERILASRLFIDNFGS